VNPTIEYVYESENSIQNNSADVAEIAKSLPAEPVFHEFALFAQDEWSVQPNLSLSLGLRWDVNPPPSAGGDGGAYTVLGSVFQPSTLQLAPPGTPLWHTSWHNFAPRLGAARVFQAKSGWETVIRGGAGVFFDTGNQQASRAFAALGYHASSVIFGVPIPVPANQLDISPSVAPPYAQIYVTSPHLQLPYTFQWNLSAEQSLGGNRAVTASYVAAAGRKLLEQQELNLATLNPTFPSIVYNQNGHGSNYQSLQLQYQQQITHGIQALGSYTWSHAIDFGSTDIALPYIRGNSDLDVRQNFEGALSWALPGRFSQRVTTATLAGWGIDARVMARSGFPITLNGNFLTDAASGSEYYGGLNLLPNQPIYLFGSQYPGGRAINKSAFSLPTTNEMGDAPRNFVRGFDAVQANLAVRKEFPLFENIKLQFRAEAFNVLNHPIFGQIDSTYTDLLFGQADATLNASLPTMSSQYQQGGSRSMQFALKLVF
jgi:hypothetical protein